MDRQVALRSIELCNHSRVALQQAAMNLLVLIECKNSPNQNRISEIFLCSNPSLLPSDKLAELQAFEGSAKPAKRQFRTTIKQHSRARGYEREDERLDVMRALVIFQTGCKVPAKTSFEKQEVEFDAILQRKNTEV